MQKHYKNVSKGSSNLAEQLNNIQTKVYVLCYLFLFLLVLPQANFAQTLGEITKIIASDRDSGDEFGISTDLDGDYAIVGAYHHDQPQSFGSDKSNAGAAYIYKRTQGGADNWGQVATLKASDFNTNDRFGISVTISGDYAVVGAHNEDENTTGGSTLADAGAVYVFKRTQGGTDGWGQIKKLVASDRGAGDRFGNSIALDGDYLLVGAESEDENTAGGSTLTSAGAAYMFKRTQGGTDSWGQIKKLVASDRATNDRFGISVAISSDYALVGADKEDENATGGSTLSDAGSAYVFRRTQGGTDAWGQIKKIVASDRTTSDAFGSAVAIDGNYAIVGAKQQDKNATGGSNMSSAGAAYVFKRTQGGTNAWGQVKKLVASDRNSSDLFGYSVGISGDYALVGAYEDNEDANNSNSLSDAGSAYLFKQDTGGGDNWGEVEKIDASDREAGDHLSRSLAIQGNYAIIGANLEDDDLNDTNTLFSAGAAYIYKRASIQLAAKVLLQGPYNSGTSMQTDLTGIMPIKEPYTALGFAALENPNTTTTTTIISFYSIVDWVVLELRDISHNIVTARAALLKSNGSVVAEDGFSAVTFEAASSGNYHVVVRHRNHLGIMTKLPMSF